MSNSLKLTSSPAFRHRDTYRAVAPQWVDVSLDTAPTHFAPLPGGDGGGLRFSSRPFNVSECPPATNIFIVALMIMLFLKQNQNQLKSSPLIGEALDPIFR